MTLKVAIILDLLGAAGNTPEDERDIILESLDLAGLSVDLVLFGLGMHEVIQSTKKIDLLILDYGGLSQGASDMVLWQVREAVKWAEDHPGSLVVLWTTYTARYYLDEWSEKFREANVLYRFRGEWDDEVLIEKIETWFQIRGD